MIATPGFSGRASEEPRNKFFAELGEIVGVAPGNLAQVGARHLHVISGSPESNQLLRQLWKAAESPRGARDFLARNETSSIISRERGAFKLADAAAADTASDPKFGSLLPEYASQLWFPEEA